MCIIQEYQLRSNKLSDEKLKVISLCQILYYSLTHVGGTLYA